MVHPRRPRCLGERGQAVEYSLIVLLIAVSLIAILGLAGKTTKRVYTKTSSAIAVPASYAASGGGGPSPTPALVTTVIPPAVEAPPDSTANADSPDSLHALAHSPQPGGLGW